jgi:mannose-6-phosphate isomerase
LGAGIVVAEIQTPSDVTYRLYDWGRQRPAADAGLHVEQALDAIEWNAPASAEPPRSHVGGLFTTVTRLVTCDAFTIEKVRFSEGMLQAMPYDELVIWIVLEGRGAILYGGGAAMPFARGDVVILPAALPKGQVRTDADCVWLEVTVPVASDLAAFNRPTAEALRDEPEKPTGTVPLNISRTLPRGHDK